MERHNIKPIVEGKGVWWHPGNRGPLKNLSYILQFGSMKFYKVRMDHTMFPHMHPGIGIRFIHSGKFQWSVEGQEVELLPDDLSITNPWQLYGSPHGKTDIGEYTWMLVKPETYGTNTPLSLGSWTQLSQNFQKNLGDLLTKENTIVLRNAKKLKKYFVEMKNELCGQETGYEIIAGNLIDNFFIELYRHLSNRKQRIEKEYNFTEELTTIITNDLNKKWIIEDLALQFGMGKTKFTDEVKKLTGYPPASFIINLKIEKAIELLKNETNNLSEIALVCGFSSLQHFTSTFSNRIGIGPAKFRVANRKQNG
ncbi:AraC family transcriptional regulator [uncultured Draconibacterium sp.]|uniref:AraC family transcriptional regulator n=1 Tax=uncultured Draconibacterium sp. TaxID=1573823 RepID=UPI0025E1D3DE|nr:AraC family transcriptional regulator [uncultured Draconibacterium sp.]